MSCIFFSFFYTVRLVALGSGFIAKNVRVVKIPVSHPSLLPVPGKGMER